MLASVSQKLVVLCALCSLYVAAHEFCDNDRVFLKNTDDVEDCASKCAELNNEELKCIAWELNVQKEKCYGYAIRAYENQYQGDYTLCQDAPNAIVDVFTEQPAYYAPPSGVSNGDGCSLKLESLGVSNTSQACKDACIYLSSNLYGGCAGWFWDKESKNCGGLLSQRGDTLCGVPYSY